MMVFHTQAYAALAAAMKLDLGAVETKLFPDGERYLRLGTAPAGQDVALVGGTISDADTLELYDLACGIVEAGARSLSLVLPYFGYATMERAALPREIVTAKTRARLLSSIPLPGSGARVLLLDLHTEGIPFYFEGALRPVHLSARKVILAAIRRLTADSAAFAIACTDAGRAKWVEAMANDLGVPAAFVFKRRTPAGTEVTAVSAQVEGRHVVIYDDLIRTGGSLLNAARAYRAAGAARISAVATHGVFPGDALARLSQSGLFDKVIVTDSHPRALSLRSAFLEVETVAPLLAAAISA
jgi:ribose-phosphate pyrophosphokinase